MIIKQNKIKIKLKHYKIKKMLQIIYYLYKNKKQEMLQKIK